MADTGSSSMSIRVFLMMRRFKYFVDPMACLSVATLMMVGAAAPALVMTPALAKTHPAKTPPTVEATLTIDPASQPVAGSNRAIGQTLFMALVGNASADSIGPLLKTALERGAKACRQISTWQVYRLSVTSRTLKVKCPSMHLYALTVAKSGDMQYSGGDGTIAPMVPSDGRVISLFGQRAEDYLHNSSPVPFAVEQHKQAQDLPGDPPSAHVSLDTDSTGAPSASGADVPLAPPSLSPVVASPPLTQSQVAPQGILPAWVLWAVVFNVVALAGIGMVVARSLRSARSRSLGRYSTEHAWGYSSDDKDHMLDESRELYPNIYSHPRGFFIARGKRGKRRLFRFAFAAMLYRDFGVKIGEIDSE